MRRQWGKGFTVSLSNRLCTRAIFSEVGMRLEEVVKVSPLLEWTESFLTSSDLCRLQKLDDLLLLKLPFSDIGGRRLYTGSFG